MLLELRDTDVAISILEFFHLHGLNLDEVADNGEVERFVDTLTSNNQFNFGLGFSTHEFDVF